MLPVHVAETFGIMIIPNTLNARIVTVNDNRFLFILSLPLYNKSVATH
jgi:hypothetical protein